MTSLRRDSLKTTPCSESEEDRDTSTGHPQPPGAGAGAAEHITPEPRLRAAHHRGQIPGQMFGELPNFWLRHIP